MIISFSGTPGSGKSTVAQMVADRLGYKRYYIGGIRREAARKRGMTIEEYNRLGETDPSTDEEVDEYQQKLGEEEDDFVIEGRTSFHFIPHSFKVYLDVDLHEAAKRIHHDENKGEGRNERTFATVEETEENLKERIASDRKRYKEYYGLDCFDKDNYDAVIDTTNITPEEAAEKVLEAVEHHERVHTNI
ncbi:MAG: (d)CMP kinase [Candidatus Woesearchaeota archaeon]